MAPTLFTSDGALTRAFGLTEKEWESRTLSRSRIFSVVAQRRVVVVGLHEGTLDPGSFLFLALRHPRCQEGLIVWGMGVRQTGEVDCYRWYLSRLTQTGVLLPKRAARRAIHRRLIALPGEAHGLVAQSPRDIAKFRVAEVLYG